MKNETGGVAIEELIGLKSNMYSFLVDYSSQYKKAKGVQNCCYNNKSLKNTKMFC